MGKQFTGLLTACDESTEPSQRKYGGGPNVEVSKHLEQFKTSPTHQDQNGEREDHQRDAYKERGETCGHQTIR